MISSAFHFTRFRCDFSYELQSTFIFVEYKFQY